MNITNRQPEGREASSSSEDCRSGNSKNFQNPLSTEEQRIIKVNAGMLGDSCPNPDCDLTPDVADVSPDGRLYVSHEEDGVGLDSRTEYGERDGCLIAPSNDPTL